MKKQMICGALALCLTFGTFAYAEDYDKYDGMQFADAGKLLIENRATYTLSSDWIYEGVVMDKEGKFPQQKYTLVKDLDEYILYGNRDIFEEMKTMVPFINKESFKSIFSNQDMAQIIASASGGETAEVDYGENHFYETITTQQVDKNGKTEYVTSIIDFFFEEDFIHSFSYSYKTRTDGLGDYKAMLASFKLGAQEQPKRSKQDMLLEAERQERARKEQERLEKEQAQLNEPTATPTPEPTIVPTATPEPTSVPVETTTSGENVASSGETIVKVEEETKVSGEQAILNESGEINQEDIVESGDIEEEQPIEIEKAEDTQEVIETPKPVVTEVRKPTKKKSTLEVVLSIPAVRRLIIFCIIFDVTITLIIKKRKKKKMQDTKEQKEYEKKEQENAKNTNEKK